MGEAKRRKMLEPGYGQITKEFGEINLLDERVKALFAKTLEGIKFNPNLWSMSYFVLPGKPLQVLTFIKFDADVIDGTTRGLRNIQSVVMLSKKLGVLPREQLLENIKEDLEVYCLKRVTTAIEEIHVAASNKKAPDQQ
ncbi:MAG: hypothetical protein F6K24_20180 [Okeania sp. SIO2D1]|nr:hypothetical protein [Okeania sp. SIO2D1]